MDEQEFVRIMTQLIEEKARLLAAGATRGDPASWRPDLTHPISFYVESDTSDRR